MSDDGSTLRRDPPSTRSPEPSLVLYHREGAKVVPFPHGGEVVVGRSWPADAVVDDTSLSRQHARFVSAPEGVTVEDLGSTNGTWLNGALIQKGRLGASDVVRLGDVTVSLHVVPPRSATGIDGHDRFVGQLEDEVRRATTFKRPLAVLMIRAAPGPQSHVSQWTAPLVRELRPVDRMGLYAPDTITISLPETARARALELASALVAHSSGLSGGVAVFPEDGSSAEELIAVVRDALSRATPARRVWSPDGEIAAPSQSSLSVHGARMRTLMDDLQRVADSSLPVLVFGETGTGKELVARAIHQASPRRGQMMRSINCAAIPATLVEGILFGHERGAFTSAERTTKGIFEQASKSTVLLDEIGELSAAAQAVLLRVLETKRIVRIGGDREIEVDVRVVAATHRDLEGMCDLGQFRRDLFYRLNAVTLSLPPLRERREEIEPLARELLAQANQANDRHVTAVDPAVWELFSRYAWPGNVRELKNVIERAVVIARGKMLSVEDLPERIRATSGTVSGDSQAPRAQKADDDASLEFKERVRIQTQRYETDLILDALQKTQGNQTEAAKLLQIPVRTLAHKMQAFGIKKRF